MMAPDYGVRETTADVKTLNVSGSNPDVLPQFVSAARMNVNRLISRVYRDDSSIHRV